MGIAVADFETERIEQRPEYPPKPVGCALKLPHRKPVYLAWGHKRGKNNITKEAAAEQLQQAYKEHEIVFHNAKFDLDVGHAHMGLPILSPNRFHDTMVLGYLDDPHARQIDLKTLAEKRLGIAPDERDELKAWILGNIKCKTSEWGAYISEAPAELVGRYAAGGDAHMTDQLYGLLRDRIRSAQMEGAYLREKAMLPLLLDMEKQGVRVDVGLLERDVRTYNDALEKLDVWLKKYLRVSPSMNLDSGEELADALEAAGMSSGFAVTPTGKRSTSKASIKAAVADPMLILALDYRSTLVTYLRTFMSPWLETARRTGGWIYTQWHSTKQQKEEGGSRTGRLSSSPNLQNVPSDDRWREAVAKFAALHKKLKWLPEMPHVRCYIVADDEDSVIIDRDYSQQEPRVLAHFEDGILCAQYQADPNLKVYEFVIDLIKETTGIVLTRKAVKTIMLGIMYGLGLGKLAASLGCSVDEARVFKAALLRAVPGIQQLTKDLQGRARRNEFMRTWGGRVYYAEPSRIINGRLQEFGYKLTNYLIQGSSADITKEAMLRYHRDRQHGRLILSVHDELAVSVPRKHWQSEMKILHEAMSSVELDVPLTSDGSFGYRWGELEECA